MSLTVGSYRSIRKTPLGKIGLEEDDVTERFAGKDSRTIGFSFHPDVSYDVDRPNTELAIKFGKLEQIHEEEQNKQDEMLQKLSPLYESCCKA